MQLFSRLRKPNPIKAMRGSDELLGIELHANGTVTPRFKQGSGMYGAGFGSQAFGETAFGVNIALSQSPFGWSAAFSQCVWVYRCIEVRKSGVHRMPWYVYNTRSKQPIPKHPLTIAIKRNRQKLLKKIEQSQLLYGETFIEKAVNENGYTSDLYWLNNNGTTPIIGAGMIMGYSYTALQGGQPQNFEPHEVAFMKTDNPFNDLRGMSPTEVIMDEIAISKDVARVVRTWYLNDTRLGVIFIPKVNLNPGDAEAFMAILKSQHQGVNKAGKPVLMPQDMTVERIQEPVTLDDMNLRESTRREICAAYGVPLSLAGGWDDAKYQSLPEQRKSFYEETIIPECESIAEFINTEIMPYFDDTGRTVFKFDFAAILALTEDAQMKNEIYSSRLASGGITRAEYRQALGHPVRPSDEVYYIPVGATIIPADQEVLVTPNRNEVTTTPQQQESVSQQVTEKQPSAGGNTAPPNQPSQSNAPAAPAAQADGDKLARASYALLQQNAKQPKAVATDSETETAKNSQPPQQTPLEELAAWERKAINSNAIKAASFVCYVLPQDIQVAIRAALHSAGRNAAKSVMRAIFAEARKAIAPPPAAALDYWSDYDKLMAEIGSTWLNDYMATAYDNILPVIGATHTSVEIDNALSAAHPVFEQALLGTDEQPGALVKLIMAGMAAGQQALNHNSAANPQRPMLGKALTIDWQLLAHEARDFAREYLYNLIRGVDDTTRKLVQDATAKWIESGADLDALKQAMQDIFHNPVRADMISQTESTRAFAEGSKERYRRSDVKLVRWATVRDDIVCETCRDLLAQGAQPLDSGFKTKDGAYVWPPAHVSCRCYLKPVIGDE